MAKLFLKKLSISDYEYSFFGGRDLTWISCMIDTNIIKGGYNLSFLYDTYMIHIEYCNFRACF